MNENESQTIVYTVYDYSQDIAEIKKNTAVLAEYTVSMTDYYDTLIAQNQRLIEFNSFLVALIIIMFLSKIFNKVVSVIDNA